MTEFCMLLIILFLAYELLFQARYCSDGTHFFDKDNSNALKGFWCFVVILVHTPAAYSNLLQDMIGSFAYIGVTFFFMTSAYGLKASVDSEGGVKLFWRKRLPKLLVPMFFVNLLSVLFSTVKREDIHFQRLFEIDRWVMWLAICYFFFWLLNRKYEVKKVTRDISVCILVVLFSLALYYLKKKEIIHSTTWCTEVYGFVWGILLFNFRLSWVRFVRRRWFVNNAVLCTTAGIIGISYLIYKPVLFWGDYILKIILGIAILLFMLALNTNISIGNRISRFLGNISYEIYLLHGLCFNIVSHYFPRTESGIYILSTLLITVILSWVIHFLSEIILKQIYAKIHLVEKKS